MVRIRAARGPTMLLRKLPMIAMLCAASLIMSCGSPDSGARKARSGGAGEDGNVLNFYTWSDYLAPDTIASFEKQTGIKVNASFFDTN
jgi:putrescine transport system substrate-binding protein